MNVMSDCRSAFNKAPGLLSLPTVRLGLDRHALLLGATRRRARAQEIEAEMDIACERAAAGSNLPPHAGSRDAWTRPAWDRYVAEAVNQARARGDELHGLLRDADRLERLAGIL